MEVPAWSPTHVSLPLDNERVHKPSMEKPIKKMNVMTPRSHDLRVIQTHLAYVCIIV